MAIALIALIPAFMLVWLTWAKNPAGKRPIGTLWLPFACGLLAILIAVGVALLVPVTEGVIDGILGFVLCDFVIVAVSEEGGKMLGMWLLEKNRKMIVPYDAIIYGAVIGFGFGAIENCAYMVDLDPMSALLRSFFAVPGHVAYGMLMGSFFALAIVDGWQGKMRERNFKLILAFTVPWFIHGLYDFLLDCDLLYAALFLVSAAIIWAVALVLIRVKDPRMIMMRPQPDYSAFGWGVHPQQIVVASQPDPVHYPPAQPVVTPVQYQPVVATPQQPMYMPQPGQQGFQVPSMSQAAPQPLMPGASQAFPVQESSGVVQPPVSPSLMPQRQPQYQQQYCQPQQSTGWGVPPAQQHPQPSQFPQPAPQQIPQQYQQPSAQSSGQYWEGNNYQRSGQPPTY